MTDPNAPEPDPRQALLEQNARLERTVDLLKLWAKHLASPFPWESHELDVQGIDPIALDAELTHCVDCFVDEGELDDKARRTLASSRPQLDTILHNTTGSERAYFLRLQRIVDMALDLAGQPARPT